MMRKLLLLSASIVAICALFAHGANAATYQIRELQVSSQGTAGFGCTGWINASSGSGKLVGAVYDSGACHAAVSDGHGDLILLSEGFAIGVNGLGQAVGYANGAALWDAAGNVTQLPLPAYTVFSQARAINDSGLIAGASCFGATDVREYITLWNGISQPENLGEGRGNAINAGGSVAGFTNDARGIHHAFAWSPTIGMTDLAGGVASEANAINGLGQVAGMVCDANSAWACLWDAGGILDLLPNLPGSIGSTAWGLNDAGAAVGSCDTADGTFAVLWEADGTLVNLGALPGSASSVAYALSDSGLIAGCSVDSDGSPHAVAWSPVPEPTSLVALLAGLAALVPRLRKEKSEVRGLKSDRTGRVDS